VGAAQLQTPCLASAAFGAWTINVRVREADEKDFLRNKQRPVTRRPRANTAYGRRKIEFRSSRCAAGGARRTVAANELLVLVGLVLCGGRIITARHKQA